MLTTVPLHVCVGADGKLKLKQLGEMLGMQT